jgi:hypothetical protein
MYFGTSVLRTMDNQATTTSEKKKEKEAKVEVP